MFAKDSTNKWQIMLFVMVVALLSYTGGGVAQEKAESPLKASAICPVPPAGYDRIPGYRPGRVDPTLSQKPLEFISPTLEGNPRFYIGILQQPVEFCGTAKNGIVKVKIVASGAYLYEQKPANPEQPEELLGEVVVTDGLWFFKHSFKGAGVVDIIAEGYDDSNKLIATTGMISLSLAEPNPR